MSAESPPFACALNFNVSAQAAEHCGGRLDTLLHVAITWCARRQATANRPKQLNRRGLGSLPQAPGAPARRPLGTTPPLPD